MDVDDAQDIASGPESEEETSIFAVCSLHVNITFY
jgi:hypothetical protein